MEKSFHFVDGTRNDKASKRQMRRFVMKGKNAGKIIHRPSRLDLAKRHPNDASGAGLSRAPGDPQEGSLASPGTVAWVHRSIYPGIPAPVTVTAHSLKVINDFFAYVADRMYPAQLPLSGDYAREAWMPLMLADGAAFHCSVALMQACNELFLGGGRSSPEALHYLAQTFAQVRRRLEGTESLSDSTIAIVLSLINQEQIRREHLGAKVHIEGLRRMVELRGGLDQLQGNLPLLLKVCKTDILFALQHGGPTLFFRDRIADVQEELASQGLSFDRASALSSIQHDGLDPDIHGPLLDALYLSALFNTEQYNYTLDVLTFQEIHFSICYRLFRFRLLECPRREYDVQITYHTGLTIFMMTLFLQFDCRRVLDYSLICLCLRDVLNNGPDEHDGSGLVLWLILVGGIWILGDADEDWLYPRIRSETRRLGLETWDEVLGVVTKFPWVHHLHGQPGRSVWNQVHCNS